MILKINYKTKLDCKLVKLEKSQRAFEELVKKTYDASIFRALDKRRKMKASNNSLIGGKNKDNTIYKIKKGEKKQSCIVGSRAKVFHGICDKTSGGLTKKDLKYNKIGKIVSKKASKSAKKAKNLKKFIAPSNTYSFSKSPKKGSNAYKKIVELSNKQKKSKKSKKSKKK